MNRARQSSARPGLQPGKENNDNQIQKSSDVQGYIIRCTRTHMQRGKKKKKFALSLHSPFRFWEEKGIWVDHKPCCGNGLGFAFLPNESSGWTDGEMNG